MKVISNRVQVTGIKGLAICFHQDYELMEECPSETFIKYVSGMNEKERKSLRREILDLLQNYPGEKQKGLLNAWFRLGAQYWNRQDNNLRNCLKNWALELAS